MELREPGRQLRALVDKSLADGCSWTETELVAIGKACRAEDRAALIAEMLDAELGLPEPSPRKVVELSGEVRRLDGQIVAFLKTLVPDPGAVSVKSRQHQDAARTRWDNRSHRSKSS